MPEILGIKLRIARENMGLTQDELAKAVGLSHEFISNLEIGRRKPSLNSLRALADFLKKDISYFLEERETAFSILRRQEKIDKKTRTLLKRFQEYCEDYLYLEEQTERRLELAPLYTNISAERMANEERRRLGLGNEPIRDIFSLLELNGLRILRHPIPEESKISGIFIFLDINEAAFALVNSMQPFGLQALSAAHEYGHFLKDRFGGPVIDNPDIFIDEYLPLYHPREKFAQTFAVQFLIPQEKVREIVTKDIRSRKINFEDVLYLKRYFGVSFLAMLRTLRNLEYLSQTRFKEFQSFVSEPQEEAIFGGIKEKEGQVRKSKRKAIFSDRFKSLAFEAYKKKRIREEKLAKLLKKDKDKIILKIVKK